MSDQTQRYGNHHNQGTPPEGLSAPASEQLVSASQIGSKHKSHSIGSKSKHSSHSIGSALALKRAQAEAAKAGAEFALKEAELKKRQALIRAELDGELTVLEHQKQVAIFEAEVRALELAEDGNSARSISAIGPHIPIDNPHDRTRKYVLDHNPLQQELQVSATEELELLIKWLGPESSKFAKSLRTANINNPVKGVARVWERLNDRYGCPEMIEAALKSKLTNFPKLSNRDYIKLFELSDILSETESLKEDTVYKTLLAYFDSSSGVIPIVNKLPYGLQEKWTSEAIRYKRQYRVTFPPFTFFTEFIRQASKAKNDPSFFHDTTNTHFKQKTTGKFNISTRKTDVSTDPKSCQEPDTHCPLHKSKHPLNDCKAFRSKPMTERKQLIRDFGVCFHCCTSSKHMAKDCDVTVKCVICESCKHPTALHEYRPRPPSTDYGGEKPFPKQHTIFPVTSKCTEICDKNFTGKSCGKTILVKVYANNTPHLSKYMYAVLDDQSNCSLARSEFFNHFNVTGEMIPYSLSSCSGKMMTSGRRANGFTVESLDGSTKLRLPTITECNQIPDIRNEIPTPEAAQFHPHLSDIAKHISPLDEAAPILLLIGRDLVEAHHVLEQRVGTENAPYAQKLRLGWVIVGETCLGKMHPPNTINVNKTHLLSDSRQSIFKPCPNDFILKELVNSNDVITPTNADPIFQTTKNDNKPGLSREDKDFLELMDNEFVKNDGGNWTAPLPFHKSRQRLPNNRPQAMKRARTLHNSLIRNPTKMEHFVTFMKGILENSHAEVAPSLEEKEECWYLPIFGVYHPRKADQIRAVFDSSATFQGISLNDVLLSGPDLTNSLLGILLRFRNERIAIAGDIQQMFYCFLVREDHRNFLRFLWYRNNDPHQDIIEYRMKVHVFGNSPSPAVATYGLRKTAEQGEKVYGSDVRDFVEKDFYADDCLTSLPTVSQAVDLMQRTQQSLATEGNLRLHKIVSNSHEVMSSFPTEDLAKDFKNLDLTTDTLPQQRSLGVTWDLETDSFTFQVSSIEKPYTRRGVLSTINSLYDPLGLAAPVVLQGKILLRELMASTTQWDEPLPGDYREIWEYWRDSLKSLESLQIPRPYTKSSLQPLISKEIHIFSDASEKAIAAVAYLKSKDQEGQVSFAFVLGKAKVAPTHGHTIPRLELCAAVLAVQISETISDELNIHVDSVYFHTDSRVVLGYINNRSRRFYIYVANRVDRILRSTDPKQWKYISTHLNPADQGTRPVQANRLGHSMWLLGPTQFESSQQTTTETVDGTYSLENPAEDNELRPELTTLATHVQKATNLGCQRFQRFSQWDRLIGAILLLKHITCSFHNNDLDCKGWHICTKHKNPEFRMEAEAQVIREVQQEVFATEMACIKERRPLPKASPLIDLNPMIDSDGFLRVGGRLNKSDMTLQEKNPLIIPGRHHIAVLLVRHYHSSVKHQGRS